MQYVIGIDAGGTKTVCDLADETGRLVAEARGGGANLQTIGELGVEKVLHDVMERVVGGMGALPSVICLGIAGVDRDEDVTVVRGIMRRIGYKARILIVNDALVALVAGVNDRPGLVIVAGTGSIAFGRNGRGEAARAGGWGYVLGDEGSGYWIGRQALRAVVRQADGRGAPTGLTPLVLGHFGVARPQDLIHAIYTRDVRPPAIAALAGHVAQATAAGDAIAAEILERAAWELVAAAGSVAKQLGLTDAAFPVVLAGGIFTAVPWLAHALHERLPTVAPRCKVARLDREPAAGALHLALAELRGAAQIPAYKVV